MSSCLRSKTFASEILLANDTVSGMAPHMLIFGAGMRAKRRPFYRKETSMPYSQGRFLDGKKPFSSQCHSPTRSSEQTLPLEEENA